MKSSITDLWFRSGLGLMEMARRLGLRNPHADAENVWEWVIGEDGDRSLDITRSHLKPPEAVFTRLFYLGKPEMTSDEIESLVSRLRGFVRGPITAGRWVYLSGNDFKDEPVRVYEDPGASPPEAVPQGFL